MTIRTMFDGQRIVLPKELEGHDPCVVEITLTDDFNGSTASRPSLWDVVARSRGTLGADVILREASDERDYLGAQVTYLDANVIIRWLEGDPATRAALLSRLQASTGGFVTSELSRLECRCRPLKQADAALVKLYDEFFASAELQLVPLDRAVIDKATELRATTRLRTPDALHLATALIQKASRFCTGDLNFKGISLMTIEIL